MNYIFVIIYSIMLSMFTACKIKPKFCIDCKYFTKKIFSANEYGKCSLFLREIDNDNFLVNGIKNNNRELHYCSTARKSERMCGETGIFYEKK